MTVGIVILVFLIVVFIAMDRMAETSRLKTLLDARRIGGSVKDNINMISQQGPGYYSYFSIPEELNGGYDYRLVLKENVLEVVWDDNAWSTKIAASNLTLYCLSPGLTRKNRIFCGENGIEITCHLPNLKVLPKTLQVNRQSVLYNYTSVDVMNDAHVDAGTFETLFKTNNSQAAVLTDRLGPGEKATLWFNKSVGEYLSVEVDYLKQVNESIETDNNITQYYG